MTPQDVDRLSFRDFNAMITGARRLEDTRERAAMARALVIGGGFHNPEILREVQKDLTKTSLGVSLEEYRERRDDALNNQRYGNGG